MGSRQVAARASRSGHLLGIAVDRERERLGHGFAREVVFG